LNAFETIQPTSMSATDDMLMDDEQSNEDDSSKKSNEDNSSNKERIAHPGTDFQSLVLLLFDLLTDKTMQNRSSINQTFADVLSFFWHHQLTNCNFEQRDRFLQTNCQT